MEKEIFKVGDKVFHFLYGWGTIQEIQDTMIDIDFNGQKVYAFSDNNLLSFTEYTLEGFSQERPIILPEVGEEVMVSDDSINWKLAKFIKFRVYDNDYLVQVGRIQESFGFIKRLR